MDINNNELILRDFGCKIGDTVKFKHGYDIYVGDNPPELIGEVIKLVKKDSSCLSVMYGYNLPYSRTKNANVWNCDTVLVKVMVGKKKNLDSYYTVPAKRIIEVIVFK